MGVEEGRSSQQVGQVAFQSLQSEQGNKWSLPLSPSEKPGHFKGRFEAEACVFLYRALENWTENAHPTNGQHAETPSPGGPST